MNVPFLDLKSHHDPYRAEFRDAIDRVIDAGAFAGGPFVESFERAFAEYCGTSGALGVGSGTDALWLALLALGVGRGDEVITVPMTFIATTEAISHAGATPVFVDIEPETYTMDPAKLEAAITPRTRAIIPVHLFGQMADMDAILEIANRHGIPVIEDAAQAHGAEIGGRRAGSLGAAGCFSFYPGKNLGAFGEGGAVTSGDQALMDRISMLRDHGQSQKYHHKVIGWNCRLDGIQGAVLEIKLRHLDDACDRRAEHAAYFNSALAGIDGLVLPATAKGRRHVFHIYAVRVSNRKAFMTHLQKEGIGCGIHYPIPVHLQEAYADLGLARGSFPVAEACADEFVSLPMFPELSPLQCERVVEVVKAFAEGGVAAA
jgi:dTDP-4-amino-4,6-dideoxygalactose transaminase